MRKYGIGRNALDSWEQNKTIIETIRIWMNWNQRIETNWNHLEKGIKSSRIRIEKKIPLTILFIFKKQLENGTESPFRNWKEKSINKMENWQIADENKVVCMTAIRARNQKYLRNWKSISIVFVKNFKCELIRNLTP